MLMAMPILVDLIICEKIYLEQNSSMVCMSNNALCLCMNYVITVDVYVLPVLTMIERFLSVCSNLFITTSL